MYMYQWDNNERIAGRLFDIAEKAGNDSGLKDGAERAAIGRLYYACYNMANDIVLNHFIYRENIPQFDELIELKGYRRHADYDKRSPISEDEIKMSKELYESLQLKLFNF